MTEPGPEPVGDTTWSERNEATRSAQRAQLDAVHRRILAVGRRGEQRRSRVASGATPLRAVVARLATAAGATAPPAGHAGERVDRPERVLAEAGLWSRPVSLRADWYRSPALAMLGYVADEPVALVPNLRGYDLIEADGARRRVTGAVAATVGGTAEEVFARLPEARAAGVRDLLRVAMAGERRGLRLVLACATFAAALGLLTPAVTGWVLGTLVPLGRDRVMVGIGAVLVVAAATSAALLVVQQLVLSGIQQGAVVRAQAAVWERVLAMPAPFFRQHSPGELALRVSAAQQLVEVVSASLVSEVLAAALALSSVVVMVRYDLVLGLIGLLMIVFTLVVLTVILRRAAPVATEMTAGMLAVNAHATEVILGASSIRDASAEPRILARVIDRIVDYVAEQAEMTRLQGVFAATVAGGAGLTSALLFFAIVTWGWGPEGPSVRAADFLGVAASFGVAYAGLVVLVSAMFPLMSARPLLLTAKPILDAVPERATGREAWTPRGAFELRHVSFRYSPESPDVLHDVSLRIDPGAFVALVGPSGAGKTTLLRILLGFETPDEGEVLIDGRSLPDLDPHVLRAEMGAVTQDAAVVGASIRDTVTGGNRLDDEAVWSALERAAVAEDVRAMPMGLETMVTTATVSGGQQQRLLLARALARSVRLVLLDEATSALDDLSQAAVMASLQAMDATRVLVAHRLSTVRAADRIVVIDDGRVVEDGTYEELMAREGLFARLVARQLA